MVSENYPTVPLSKFHGRMKGKAMFKEPVFKLGVFQDRYIDVEVMIFEGDVKHPNLSVILTPVRFGQMNVIRYVDSKLLIMLKK